MTTFLVNGFGGVHGGIVRVHNAICQELAERGSVAVASAPREQQMLPGVSILSDQEGGRAKAFARDARKSLSFHRYDVRVDTAPAFRLFTASRRHIVVVHDLNFLSPSVHQISAKQLAYRRLLHSWTLRRADKIVVNSEATRDEVARFMPSAAARVQVLPLPVDYILDRRGERRRDPLGSAEHPRLLTFGHARNKGVDRLIEVLQGWPGATLHVIAPEQAWRDHWRDMVEEAGVGQRVEVLSNISDDQLVAEYLGANVFCMLSTYEGYGLPVAEALALGVPTVISDIPVLSGTARGYAVVAAGIGVEATTGALREALAMDDSHWARAAAEIGTWHWKAWVNRMLEDEL